MRHTLRPLGAAHSTSVDPEPPGLWGQGAAHVTIECLWTGTSAHPQTGACRYPPLAEYHTAPSCLAATILVFFRLLTVWILTL